MEKLSDFLVRPFRSTYQQDELGPQLFLMNENIYERMDFQVKNKQDQNLSCSLWSPKLKNEETYMGVVFCHGNCGNKLNVFEILEMLLQNNLVVIAFDFSGAGLSEGEIVTYGHNEHQDIASVVEYSYLKLPFISSLALWGRSMGASSILLYLQQYQQMLHLQLNDYVTCAVCDSPFANISEVIKNVMSSLQIPTMFFRNYLYSKIQAGYYNKTSIDLSLLNPLDKVCQIKHQSVLFIHGDNDTLIPVSHSLQLYQNSNKQARLNVHANGGHNDRRTDAIYTNCLQFLQGQNILKLGKKFSQKAKKKTLKQEFIQQFTQFSFEIPSSKNSSMKKSQQKKQLHNKNNKNKDIIYNPEKSLDEDQHNQSDLELLNLSIQEVTVNDLTLTGHHDQLSDNEHQTSPFIYKKQKKKHKVQELKESLRKKQQFFSNSAQHNSILLQENVQDFLEKLDHQDYQQYQQLQAESQKQVDIQQIEIDQELKMFIQQNKKRQKKNTKIRKNNIF